MLTHPCFHLVILRRLVGCEDRMDLRLTVLVNSHHLAPAVLWSERCVRAERLRLRPLALQARHPAHYSHALAALRLSYAVRLGVGKSKAVPEC